MTCPPRSRSWGRRRLRSCIYCTLGNRYNCRDGHDINKDGDGDSVDDGCDRDNKDGDSDNVDDGCDRDNKDGDSDNVDDGCDRNNKDAGDLDD